MNLSIIIPTYRRYQLLKNCLTSIFNYKHSDLFQILICINGEDDETHQQLLNDFGMKQNIEVFRINSSTPSYARNFCLDYVTNQYIHFLDDDTYIPEHFYSNLDKLIKAKPELDIIGGPDQPPLNGNFVQTAFAVALASPFCSGSTWRRHSINQDAPKNISEKVFTLANLIFKTDFLKKHQLRFSEKYFRNEENHLLKNAFSHKPNAHFDVNLFVYHYRREKLSHCLKGIHFSGYYRMRLLFDMGLKDQFDFLVFPMIFFFSQLILFSNFSFITLAFIGLYAVVAYISAFIICWREKQLDKIILVWPLHYLIPFYFTTGLLRKISSVFFKKLKDGRAA